jgi:hypothetical protein
VSTSKNLRSIIAVTLALGAGSAFAQAVTVVEFYNRALDAYFITGRVAEQQSLDAQADFRRTGMTFDANAATGATTSTTRICRFYISLASPPTSSHFYGREGVDCEQIVAQNPTGFSYEGYDFAVAQPQGGVCPTGTKTVYRGFRAAAGGKTPNHRYTTSPETYNIAQAQGYFGEDAAFCATSSTDVTPTVDSTQKCGTFYYPAQRISYQSINSEGTPGSFQRFLNTSPTNFNGHPDAIAVVERFASAPTFSTMIIDGATSWTALGSTTIDNDGLNEIYYSTPTVYPREFATGQVVNINRQLTYSRANAFGNVTQVGKRTYIGKESVTVPLGTYNNACKFVTELVTAYPGTGQTITEVSTSWIADALGIVKTVLDVKTVSPASPMIEVTTTTEANFAQPL